MLAARHSEDHPSTVLAISRIFRTADPGRRRLIFSELHARAFFT
jgi:hypothetical protein